MDPDIEKERKELLRIIDETIDPKLREILDEISNAQKSHSVARIVTSTEGTVNASAK